MSMEKNYDESSSPGGSLRKDVSQSQAQYFEDILPEERELFRNCIYGNVLKSGIPFALVLHYWSKYAQNKAVTPVAPKPFLMRTFVFFGNVAFGSLLFTPLCVRKLQIFHEENKNKKELLNTNFPAVEGVSSSSGSEDFSYPSDIINSLNEPESSFSSDFSSSSLLNNEEEKKLLSTTYEDLRNQNRSGTSQSNKKPPLHLNAEPQQGLDPLSAPIKSSTFNDPPSFRRVTKKNKYGDEME